jgi:hypothetical protein
VAPVYFVTVVGLDPLELVLVGTVMEGAILVCEVPTGVFADVFGRRLSVAFGTALMGVGFVLVGALPSLGPILAANALWGVGYTFTSGAAEAWVADEVGEARLGRTLVRGGQAEYAGAIVGVFASVALALVSLRAPIVVAGALGVALAAYLAVAMRESGAARRRAERESFLATGRTGARLVRVQPILLLVLAVAFFWGMASEGFDRLWEAHLLLDVGLPSFAGLNSVLWFGVLNAGALVGSFLVAEVLVRRVDLASHIATARALAVLTALLLAAVLAFALAVSFAVAVAAFWAVALLRALRGPLWSAWVNQHVDARYRATMLSIVSQGDAFGQVAGGPGIGAVGSAFSIRAAIGAAALLLAPALLLTTRTLRLSPRAGTPQRSA